MLGSALPATASIHTSTSSATPTSPTRPSRLRGLSYLRNYTHQHLHPQPLGSPSPAPAPLRRTISTPAPSSPSTPSRQEDQPTPESSSIQSGENGWVPTVQGRSGLSRESLNPTSTSTESAAPEPSTTGPRSSMTRARAATAVASATGSSAPQTTRQTSGPVTSISDSPSTTANASSTTKEQLPTIRFIPHLETRSTRPSLSFTTLTRTLKDPTSIVRVGRYSERDNTAPESANTLPVGFKSKVVSRRHCELWCTNGQWYIKDVKSSSGTFLNHVRLSSPNQESRPFPVNDGDVVQLGIDFKGGEEVIFRCVKIRIECNRDWQKSLNAYNTSAHRRLLKSAGVKTKNRDSDAASVNSSECSICLNPVAPCQALFVAPCSHVWHYKCVRNLIHGPNWPNFLCPNCRFVADLEADVEPPEEEDEEEAYDPKDFDEEMDATEMFGQTTSTEEAGQGTSSNEQQDGTDTDGSEVRAGHSRDEQNTQLLSPPQQRSSSSSSRQSQRRPSPSRRSFTDEELSTALDSTSLCSPPPTTQQHLAPPAVKNTSLTSSTSSTSTSGSRPMTIPGFSQVNANFHRRIPSSDLTGAQSMTPTSHAQFALSTSIMSDNGPMTPRNDAGPFVLDGSGSGRGRAGVDGIAAQVVREESEEGRSIDQ